jgi:peptide/nickel transport system permease protein
LLRFLLRKLPSLAFVVFASSIIAFILPRLAPGDPAVALAGSQATPEQIAAIRKEVGLDQPLMQQYLHWVGGVFHGDFGQSYILHRPVSGLISSRLESTLELTLVATIIMVAVGLGLGVAAGSPRSKWAAGLIRVLNTLLLATPAFLSGLFLILLFGILLPVLPVSGEVGLLQDPQIGIQYLILPATALALPEAAIIARLVQTSMLGVRSEDFVDLAVAKGVPPRTVTRKHVLRNSLGTGITSAGLRIGHMLGGAIVLEAIFARNGLGQLAVTSVQDRDYLVLQALIIGSVIIAMLAQLATEIILAGLDPRIRLGGST